MEDWVTVMKMLADDTRRKIVCLLLAYDLCVGALACRTQVSEAAVSQHLRLLRESGLVSGEKRGYYTHYRVNRDLLLQAAHGLQDFADQIPDSDCRSGCRFKQGKHVCSRGNDEHEKTYADG